MFSWAYQIIDSEGTMYFHGYQCTVMKYLPFIIGIDPDVLFYVGNFTFGQTFSLKVNPDY